MSLDRANELLDSILSNDSDVDFDTLEDAHVSALTMSKYQHLLKNLEMMNIQLTPTTSRRHFVKIREYLTEKIRKVKAQSWYSAQSEISDISSLASFQEGREDMALGNEDNSHEKGKEGGSSSPCQQIPLTSGVGTGSQSIETDFILMDWTLIKGLNVNDIQCRGTLVDKNNQFISREHTTDFITAKIKGQNCVRVKDGRTYRLDGSLKDAENDLPWKVKNYFKEGKFPHVWRKAAAVWHGCISDTSGEMVLRSKRNREPDENVSSPQKKKSRTSEDEPFLKPSAPKAAAKKVTAKNTKKKKAEPSVASDKSHASFSTSKTSKGRKPSNSGASKKENKENKVTQSKKPATNPLSSVPVNSEGKKPEEIGKRKDSDELFPSRIFGPFFDFQLDNKKPPADEESD